MYREQNAEYKHNRKIANQFLKTWQSSNIWGAILTNKNYIQEEN
jgi:hypothetical protein